MKNKKRKLYNFNFLNIYDPLTFELSFFFLEQPFLITITSAEAIFIKKIFHFFSFISNDPLFNTFQDINTFYFNFSKHFNS